MPAGKLIKSASARRQKRWGMLACRRRFLHACILPPSLQANPQRNRLVSLFLSFSKERNVPSPVSFPFPFVSQLGSSTLRLSRTWSPIRRNAMKGRGFFIFKALYVQSIQGTAPVAFSQFCLRHSHLIQASQPLGLVIDAVSQPSERSFPHATVENRKHAHDGIIAAY